MKTLSREQISKALFFNIVRAENGNPDGVGIDNEFISIKRSDVELFKDILNESQLEDLSKPSNIKFIEDAIGVERKNIEEGVSFYLEIEDLNDLYEKVEDEIKSKSFIIKAFDILDLVSLHRYRDLDDSIEIMYDPNN